MTIPADAPQGHAADVSIRMGKGIAFDASITAAGLLSVGALVSGILLSSAVIVFAAKRKGDAAAPAGFLSKGGG
jgi:hypothetical protein